MSAPATRSDAPAAGARRFSRDEISALLARRRLALVALGRHRLGPRLRGDGARRRVAELRLPLAIVLALFVIGARQLGLRDPDARGRAPQPLREPARERLVGNWLCAYPVWSDLRAYRAYHLQHHAKTGTAEDPDLGLVLPFPITRASLRRKIWRDLSGQTGLKFARGALRSGPRCAGATGDANARRAAASASRVDERRCCSRASPRSATPELYLLWVGAWLTTQHAGDAHPLDRRARDDARPGRPAAQHAHHARALVGAAADRAEPRELPPRAPPADDGAALPPAALHRLLRERGVLDGACVERGYRAVLRRAASKGTEREPVLVRSAAGGAPRVAER